MTQAANVGRTNAIGAMTEMVNCMGPADGPLTQSIITPVRGNGRSQPLIHAYKLERRRGRANVTSFTTPAVHGRLEDGPTNPFIPTPMSRLISTCIPLYQPDGRLSVPPDDWAELRAIVEDEGASLDFEETSKRGFIFGGHQGLPVYTVSISVPDGIDEADVIGRVDPALKAIIRRNLTPTPAAEPV